MSDHTIAAQVVGLITMALAASDLNALLSAINDAERMNPPLKHPKLDDAHRMKDVLEEEKVRMLAYSRFVLIHIVNMGMIGLWRLQLVLFGFFVKEGTYACVLNFSAIC